MKKLSLYLMGLLALGFVACDDDDYAPEVGPQSNPQESLLQVDDVTIAEAETTIDLANYVDAESGDEQLVPIATVDVREGTMPANTVLKAVVELSPDVDFTKKITVDAESLEETNVISVLPSKLQAAYYSGITRNPAEQEVYVRVVLYTVTDGEAEAIVGKPGENYFNVHKINFKPLDQGLKISQNYYIVGGTLDWGASAASKEQKFSHSDADVYEDPVFTIMLQTNAGETWFAIGDDEACDAIANEGDYSKLLGTTAGNGNSGMEGMLAPRTELSDDGSFKVVGDGGYVLVTINMMDYTYTIAPVSSQFYIFGDFAGWNGAGAEKNLMVPEGGNKFSYIAQFNGNVKIWAAGDFNMWSACYNTSKENDGSTALTGAIEQSDGGAIHSPEDGLFKFTLDLSTMTYAWEKLADQNPATYTSVSLIGNFNSWGGDVELTEVNPHNWYCEFTQTDAASGELKFRANHDWPVNWGYGSDGEWTVSTSAWAHECSNGAGNIKLPVGTYDVYLNDISGQARFVKK